MRQIARTDRVARPFIVGAIGDDEFDFVAHRQMVEVAPEIALAFAAARTFEVHDLDDARVEPADVDRARSFDHHGRARFEHRIRQRIHAFLQQRFAAGDFDQVTSVAANYFDDFGDWHPPAFIECVLGVAPFASQVASGEPHEHAWTARVRGFALDAVKDFVDMQAFGNHSYQEPEANFRAASRASSITTRSGTLFSAAIRRQSSYSGEIVVGAPPFAPEVLTRTLPHRVSTSRTSRCNFRRPTG